MDELSSLRITSDNHESLSGVKLLAELDNALEIVVEYVLVLHVELALFQTVLIAFHHLEDDFLVTSRAFEEVLDEALFLDFFRSFFHVSDKLASVFFFVIVLVIWRVLNVHFQIVFGNFFLGFFLRTACLFFFLNGFVRFLLFT